MLSPPRIQHLVPLIVIALVCAAASAPIWIGPGIINTRGGGDSPFLLIRTYELAVNLRAGVFPARWMPDAAYGLGYPFFNYYASLPYYLAAGLNVIGVDLLFAIKFTQTIGMFAAGFAMWLFARSQYLIHAWSGGLNRLSVSVDAPVPKSRSSTQAHLWGDRGDYGTALAACAYVLAPFHLVNVYVRGDALSEFWAFVWYPLILWGVRRLTSDGGQAGVVGRLASGVMLSLSMAALVLTHNVSALLFAPFIVIYALAHLHPASVTGQAHSHIRASALSLAVALLLAAVFALALSAWFWLPALGEAPSAQLTEQTTGYFNYANHFRDANLVQSSLAVNYTVNDSGDAFAMGFVQAALVAFGVLAWGTTVLRERRRASAVLTNAQSGQVLDHRVREQGDTVSAASIPTRVLASSQPDGVQSVVLPETRWGAFAFDFALVLLAFLLATFMLTPLSAWVWEHAPLLKLAQFPWRMLSVQAVFAAVLIGKISEFRFPSFDSLQASQITPPIEIRRPRVALWPTPVVILATALLVVSAVTQLPNDRLNIVSGDVWPHTIQLYEWYTGNIGTTIRAEYLPGTFQPRPYVGPDLLGQPRHVLIAQDGVPPEVVTSHLVSRTPTHQVWQVMASQDVWVTLPMIYTPAWQARLNNGPVATSAYVGSGWTALHLPRGNQRVELTYIGTPLQNIADLVSLVASLTLAIWVAFVFVRSPLQLIRWGIRWVALLAVVVATGYVILAWQNSTTDQRIPEMNALDFQSRPFPHRGSIVFEDVSANARYELIGVSLIPDHVKADGVKAGDLFTLTLQWRDDKRPPVIEITQETPVGGEFTDLFRSDRQVTRQAADSTAHALLKSTLPGPLLVKLTVKDSAGLLQAHEPSGNALMTLIGGQWTPGVTLLGGSTVTAAYTQPVTHTLVTFANGIALTAMDWFFSSAHSVCLRPTWTRARFDVNRADALQVSMRLLGSDGRLIAQADAQPQAGLAPTWSWPDGSMIQDSQCVPTKDTVGLLNAGESYTIDIVWYRVATLQPTGQATLRGTRGPGLNDLNEPKPKG